MLIAFVYNYCLCKLTGKGLKHNLSVGTLNIKNIIIHSDLIESLM
jgi:hypothetical protein